MWKGKSWSWQLRASKLGVFYGDYALHYGAPYRGPPTTSLVQRFSQPEYGRGNTYGYSIPGFSKQLLWRHFGGVHIKDYTHTSEKLRVNRGYNGFSITYETSNNTPTRYITSVAYGGVLPIGFTVGGRPRPAGYTATIARLNSLAAGRAYEALEQLYTKVQGIVEVGEAGKTARMLRDRSTKVVSGLTSLASDFKSFQKDYRKALGPHGANRKAATGLYMEATFGWQPLVNSIQSSLAVMDSPPVHRRESVKGVAIDKVTHVERVDASYAGVLRAVGTLTHEFDIRVKYGGLFAVNYDSQFASETHFGFTPINFLPAAWELTPYSWLIDYIANIDQIITAIASAASRPYHGTTYRVEMVKHTAILQLSLSVPGFTDPSTGNGRKVKLLSFDGEGPPGYHDYASSWSCVDYQRTVGQWPVPGLVLHLPDLATLGGKLQTLNALCLAEQQRQRKDPRLKWSKSERAYFAQQLLRRNSRYIPT